MDWLFYLTGVAALVAGIVAGIFYTFSDFVMRALKAASSTAGAEAMQEINRKVYSSGFLVMLMGLAPVSALLAILAVTGAAGPAAGWLLAGAAIYLVGVMLVTIVVNVPMNKRLDVLDPASAEAHAYWSDYARRWTAWNHVRTAASIAATLFYGGALTALAAATG
jgi:uncharacterized membrane protein